MKNSVKLLIILSISVFLVFILSCSDQKDKHRYELLKKHSTNIGKNITIGGDTFTIVAYSEWSHHYVIMNGHGRNWIDTTYVLNQLEEDE